MENFNGDPTTSSGDSYLSQFSIRIFGCSTMNISNITFNNVLYKYCKYDESDSDLVKDVKTIALMFLCVFAK